MLIKQILENDLDNCEEVLSNDRILCKREDEFQNLFSNFTQDKREEAEDLLSSIEERIVRIAYLQGLKDMYNLSIDLKKDTNDILDSF